MNVKNNVCSIAFTIFITSIISLGATDRPKWIEDTSDICKKSELCTVGMGESRNLAGANARANMAKIFKTEVKSKFSSELVSDNSGESQRLFESIQETTEQSLEGVEIEKVYYGDEYVYALAVASRHKLSLGLKKKVDELDDQIKNNLKTQKTGEFLKISSLLKERSVLAARYHFLTGIDLNPPISYKNYLREKKKITKGIVVHLWVNEESPKVIQPFVLSLLNAQGFEVTQGELMKKKATHLLTGDLKSNKEFLNVKGFEKYRFLLELSAQSRDRVKSGSLSIDVMPAARSFEQCREQALKEIKNKIQEEIYKLSFKKSKES